MTTGVLRISPLQAMFAWAEEHLKAERPEGFNVEEIGRLAFYGLPEDEREQAFNELSYTYWEAMRADEAILAHSDELQAQRQELRCLLGQFEDLAQGSGLVPYALLLEIARLSLPLVGTAS